MAIFFCFELCPIVVVKTKHIQTFFFFFIFHFCSSLDVGRQNPLYIRSIRLSVIRFGQHEMYKTTTTKKQNFALTNEWKKNNEENK